MELINQEEVEEEEKNEVILAVRELRDKDGDIEMNFDEIPYWKEEIINEEEEFKEGTLLILDTNILISYLPLLDSFIKLLNTIPTTTTQQNLPILIIPHIVLRELDGLKSSSRSTDVSESITSTSSNGKSRRSQRSISTLAREATSWLLKMYPTPSNSGSNSQSQRAFVRGQRIHETLTSTTTSIRGENGGNNDDKILDCTRFYKEIEIKKKVILISNDKNLCLKAKFEGVSTLILDDSFTELKLLKSVEPSLLISLPSTFKNSSTTTKSIHSSPLPPRPPAPPPPSTFQTNSNPNSMETTLTNPPTFKPLPPPLLHPIISKNSIILNLHLILHQFLNSSLGFYLFNYLFASSSSSSFKLGGGWEGRNEIEWLEIIRNWKEWTGKDLIRIVKEWWIDAGLRDLCEKGLDHRFEKDEKKVVVVKKEKKEEKRVNSGISRWASSSPLIAPPLPQPPSNRPTPSTTQRLLNLQSSFPRLLIYLETPLEESQNWSSPKFEIFLEELEEFLIVLLSGLNGVNLDWDVREITGGWLRDLDKVEREGMKRSF